MVEPGIAICAFKFDVAVRFDIFSAQRNTRMELVIPSTGCFRKHSRETHSVEAIICVDVTGKIDRSD